jgi:hypothetical protein
MRSDRVGLNMNMNILLRISDKSGKGNGEGLRMKSTLRARLCATYCRTAGHSKANQWDLERRPFAHTTTKVKVRESISNTIELINPFEL